MSGLIKKDFECRVISKTGTPEPLVAAGYTPIKFAKRRFVPGGGRVHRGPCACSCCSAYFNGTLSTGEHYEYYEVWVSKESVNGSWDLVTDKLGITNDWLYLPKMAGKKEYL